MLRRAPKILLSYRRADTGATAGRLADHLKRRFGANNVFIDVDNIPYGRDFRDHIHQTLANCDVVIALIGPGWTGAGDGHRRIDDAEDHLRIEIETAFETGTAVIPVLTDFAKMPTSTELPPSISKLAFINAAPLSSGRDFEVHTQRISDAAQALISPQKGQERSIEFTKSNFIDCIFLFIFQYVILFVSYILSLFFVSALEKTSNNLICSSLYCAIMAYTIGVLFFLTLLTTICAILFGRYTDKKIDPFVYVIALIMAVSAAYKILLGVNVLEFDTGPIMYAALVIVLNIPSLMIAGRNEFAIRLISKNHR